MIGVNTCFITHHVVFPLFDTLHQCIWFLVICRIVNHCTIASFRMKKDTLTILHEDCTHGVVTIMSLNLKWLSQVWKCKYWGWTDLFLQCIKGFFLFASPLKNLFHTSQCMQRSCYRRKVSKEFPLILGCSQKTSYLSNCLGPWPIQNDINLGRIYFQLTSSKNMTQLY